MQFRYEVNKFTVDMDSELHGFGGYFECTLYKDVMISINPETHSPGIYLYRYRYLKIMGVNFVCKNFRNVQLVPHLFSTSKPSQVE